MAIKEYVTSAQAAKTLGVSQRRVLQFVRDGRLRGERMGKFFLFDSAAIKELAKTPRKPGPRKVRRVY